MPGRGTELTPEEKAAALAEGKARGLPPGWDVTLDKRKRRKWISPSGRSCDSIPKALTMSVEMGLLPADTVIAHPPPKRKRGRPPKETNKKKKTPGKRGRPPKNPKPILDLTKSIDEQQQEEEEEENYYFYHRNNKRKKHNKKAKLVGPAGVESAAQHSEDEEDEHIHAAAAAAVGDDEDHYDDDSNEDEEEEMEPPIDPETTLQPTKSHLMTVHWNPQSAEGTKIGWRIRLSEDKTGEWFDGRIVRYDPCTHKHKVVFLGNKTRPADKVDKDNATWIHLRMEDGVQVATRLVWAHVKGYAWWPAMVMESDFHNLRQGYTSVEFFGSAEVATLRAGPESLRSFEHGKVDPIIAKNKKKRNAAAVTLAQEEEATIRKVQNDAAKYYARQAYFMNKHYGGRFVGRRIQLFRSDVNYPYGDTITGRVLRFSPATKKWLVAYDMSDKVRKKYEASWVNLQSKEHKVRVLDNNSNTKLVKGQQQQELTDLDLIPFLLGWKNYKPEEDNEDENGNEQVRIDTKKPADPKEGTDDYLEQALEQRCHGCVEYWKKDDVKVTCNICEGSFHLGCTDPPLTPDAHQKLLRGGAGADPFVCSRCIPCKGCYQKDITFGSHLYPLPATLSVDEEEDKLYLCYMCTKAYDKEQFCPNCAHSWDDEHFQHVQRQIRWQQVHRPKKRGRKRKRELEDPTLSADWHPFTAPATVAHEDPLPPGAKVNPTWYHAETAQWGYTEVDMLTCDNCKLWVHAGCAGLDEDEYDITSNGDHEIYSKEFLCRVCCRQRCLDIIQGLQREDSMFLFAEPVSEKVAPNYLDVIKQPMDLQTMFVRAQGESYKNYAWVREMFELMVLNALTFNRPHTAFWKEAKRFHKACLDNVFKTIGRAAPPGPYAKRIQENFDSAKEAKKLEENRVQEDKSTEKKDLVAGAKVATVNLPSLREKPVDVGSCVQYVEAKIKPTDAYFGSWMDACYTCGSSGAADTMLFCVDCGEAFHSFCANAPIHSMELSSAAGWRCPNCKICEISGETPEDEQKMLFCEMCDRGFSLDLLDPPLRFAPPGLWVCGQCVDCHKCQNTLEPHGASLKHWSRDPNLCYRCGGCDGLVDRKTRKCPVCCTVWRDDDDDLAQCAGCEVKVHARCDARAGAYLKRKESNAVASKKESGPAEYNCPSCCKKQGIKKDTGIVTRGHMYDHVSKVVQQGVLLPGEEMAEEELKEKLIEQIDWKTRNLWRDEYRRVVLEGVRFLTMAREQFGDPRYVMDRFWQECDDLPSWMGQRATRFIHVAKKLKLDTLGFSARRIEHCVMISKLAASWLKVACRVMGLKTKRNVKGYDRVVKLLKAPNKCGTTDLAYDSIRCERNRNIINKDEWLERFEPKLKPIVQTHILKESSDGKKGAGAAVADGGQPYTLANPLCGWNDYIDTDDDHRWNDPRECCLCHLCGDDDAGFLDAAPDEHSSSTMPAVPHVGRLLPMGDGYWVHASCALWSSETWESSSGGLLNAMEKARSRGAQLKCFGCGRPGATVGCVKGNCSFNYHFPCAVACGAVFTSSKEMYCAAHRDSTDDIVPNPSIELMKTLIIAPEKSKAEQSESAGVNLCSRVGALVVHSLGEIEQECDGFHNADYITPPGYVATRIYWSTVHPRRRTVYVMTIDMGTGTKPTFTITPADNPTASIKASSSQHAYNVLMKRVDKANESHFSQGDLFSKLPTKRQSRKGIFGLNGPQFFGYGMSHVRKALESSPGVEAVVATLNEGSPQYQFCFTQPSVESIVELQRKRAALAAEKKLENSSGCARTEGMTAVARSGGSDRITRALVRKADADAIGSEVAGGKKQDTEKAKADRSRMALKYRQMKAVPIEQRLVAKRSHIHGWGLFTKVDVPKNSMIVEYMGEIIRQSVADKREKQYEISGEGSCYMFRLDMQRIVDATMIGCMARFMNHCCRPNAYAKVITVDTDLGVEKKIMVFALQEIKAGEEITYDYKFPVEDGSLKCTCGAPNCIGRMN
eukprot:scaffold22599_cov139-Cylindrotheca_fusiformis.AAC.37